MKILAFSDTHGTHKGFTKILEAASSDLIIFSGDAEGFASVQESATSFLDWLINISKFSKYGVVAIAGNHDSYFVNQTFVREYLNFTTKKVYFLYNELIRIADLSIWGSPASLRYGEYSAFTVANEELLMNKYRIIPSGLDICITHTPPAGVFKSGIGSRSLADKIALIRPKISLSGHIHADGGQHIVKDNISYVNVCSHVSMYRSIEPVIIQYDEVKRSVSSVNVSDFYFG